MAQRKARPTRSREAYDNERYASSEGSTPPDDRTLREDIFSPNLIRPQYKDGPLIFRPWPELDPQDPNNNILPGRKSVNPNGQNNWAVRMSAARYIGVDDGICEKATFLLCYPWEEKEARHNNPYMVFHRACQNAYKAGKFAGGQWDAPSWNPLMQGGEGRGEAISRSKKIWFIQAQVFSNGQKDYVASRDEQLPLGAADGDELTVLQVPGSAGDAMMKLLDTENPNEPDADPDRKPWRFFRYGDPTGIYNPEDGTIRGGLIMVFFNPKVSPSWQPHSTFTGTIGNFQGYEAAVRPKTQAGNGQVFQPHMDQRETQRVFDKCRYWFDNPDDPENDPGLLYVPSQDEQALLVAKAFQTMPRLVKLAWRDRPEFFTDDVKSVLQQRRAATVPGEGDAMPPAGGDPQPATGGTPDPAMGSAPFPDDGNAQAPADDDVFGSEPPSAQTESDPWEGQQAGEATSQEDDLAFPDESAPGGDQSQAPAQAPADAGGAEEGFGDGFGDDVPAEGGAEASGADSFEFEIEEGGGSDAAMNESLQEARNRGQNRSSQPPQAG